MDNAENEMKFKNFATELDTNADLREKFRENPFAVLFSKGIFPEFPAIPESDGTALKEQLAIILNTDWDAKGVQGGPFSGKCEIVKDGWGYQINMDEEFTKNIIDRIGDVGTFGKLLASGFAAVGAFSAGIGVVIGAAVAIVIWAKVAQIKIADKGNGVRWPLNYFQIAGLVAAVPGGPTTVAIAAAVWLHPFGR